MSHDLLHELAQIAETLRRKADELRRTGSEPQSLRLLEIAGELERLAGSGE